jgi:hypothetical protein
MTTNERTVAIVVVLSVAGVCAAQAQLIFRPYPFSVQSYDYGTLTGGTEHYLMFQYQVSNETSSQHTNAVRWSVVTPDGRQFDDGYHPLVVKAYCGEACMWIPTDQLLTALTVNKSVMPGAKLEAIAVMGPLPVVPETFRLLGGQRHQEDLWTLFCKGTSSSGFSCKDPPARTKGKRGKARK